MRHAKASRIVRRGITKNRLAASKRFLKREREKAPLFAAEIAAEQPIPEQRIAIHDNSFAWWQKEDRDRQAKNWRRARALLRAAPPQEALLVLQEWQYGSLPGSPAYLLDLILVRITRGEPQNPFNRRIVEKWIAGKREGGDHGGRRITNFP